MTRCEGTTPGHDSAGRALRNTRHPRHARESLSAKGGGLNPHGCCPTGSWNLSRPHIRAAVPWGLRLAGVGMGGEWVGGFHISLGMSDLLQEESQGESGSKLRFLSCTSLARSIGPAPADL
jgi:hypothetical protein